MTKRTFLDFYSDYGQDHPGTYAELFLKWNRVNGYLPSDHLNSIYSWNYFQFKAPFNTRFSPEEIKRASEKINKRINDFGINSELYDEYKEHLIDFQSDIEKDFGHLFMESIFPDHSFYPKFEAAGITVIFDAFKEYLETELSISDKMKVEGFLNNFDLFLHNLPFFHPNEEYFLVRPEYTPEQSIGVFAFDKKAPTHLVIFYQIGKEVST